MADADIGNLGFTDKRHTQGKTTVNIATPANYVSVSALKTRLTAISGTTFTAARLNTMTKNDMLYALRLNDDSAGV